jgi:hypothetical protein
MQEACPEEVFGMYMPGSTVSNGLMTELESIKFFSCVLAGLWYMEITLK